MANRELAKKIKAAITAKPELWDQHKWAATSAEAMEYVVPEAFDEGEGLELTCGTTMCIAGWACHLSGEKIDWRAVDLDHSDDGDRLVAHRLKSGKGIEERAAELLGLEQDVAGLLFYTYDQDIVEDRLDQIIEEGCIYDAYRLQGDDPEW